MSTSIDALHNQIDAANAEIDRIKNICHELYLEDDPIGVDYHERVEIAMRDILGLSKPVNSSDRQGEHTVFSDKDIPF